MLTALIDYGGGNLHSAGKAFRTAAAEHDAGEIIVTARPEDVARADRIVLPGDGALPACRDALMHDRAALYEAIVEAVTTRARPFLGICVGMQMMAALGREHRDTPGFAWIGGEVTRIVPTVPEMKVPHMGWNDLIMNGAHPVLNGISTGDHAYFAHSYHMCVDDPAERLAHVDYGGEVTAIVGKDTMIGTQFHPEKSQGTGGRLIANFLGWSP